MSGYENAPATKLLASHCVACGRPLVDAVSVETGMGPDCRERHGYEQEADEATRKEVNARVFELALWRRDPSAVDLERAVEDLKEIRARGFVHLADVLEVRLCKVQIEKTDDPTVLAVRSPYSYDLIIRAHALSMRWDYKRKVWVFPAAVKSAVFKALCSVYPGLLGVGPRGVFPLTPGQ